MTATLDDEVADLRLINAELQRRLDERTAERDEGEAQKAAMAEVLQVINASPGDLAPVFDAMLEKAMRLCEAAFGTLTTFENERWTMVAERGLPEPYVEYLSEGTQPGSTGTHSRILAGAAFAHVNDLMDEEPYRSGAPARRALVDLGGARTALTMPLRKDGVVLGAFTIYRQEVRPFTDKQIALLENFAAQAVIAMENARLITETREALEQQTATAEVLGVINSSPGDLAPVFDAMLEKAVRLCGADSGHLALPSGDDYRAVAVFGMSREMETLVRSVSYAPGRGTAVGRALLERRVVQIDDVGGDPEHSTRQAATLGLIRTVVGVPLLREGEPVGALGLTRSRVEPFTERQIALIA